MKAVIESQGYFSFISAFHLFTDKKASSPLLSTYLFMFSLRLLMHMQQQPEETPYQILNSLFQGENAENAPKVVLKDCLNMLKLLFLLCSL